MTKFNTFNLVNFNYEIFDMFDVWAKVALNGKYYDVNCDIDVYAATVSNISAVIDIDTNHELDINKDDIEYIKDNLNREIATKGCKAVGLPDLGGDYSVDIESEGGDVRISLNNPVFVYNNKSNSTEITYITNFYDLSSDSLKELDNHEILGILKGLLIDSPITELPKPYELLDNSSKDISDNELLELFKKAL